MIAASPPQLVSTPISPSGSDSPRAWRWTAAKYDRAADEGWFDRVRVELIRGKVVMMAPQFEPHILAVKRCDVWATAAFAIGCTTRRQAPLALGVRSKPEPDVAVVVGSDEDYIKSGPPTTALLIIEVSQTTPRSDRSSKLALYAQHGILDYWILNLVDWRLEVHRQPIRDKSARWGYRYAEIIELGSDGEIAPIARPDAKVRVEQLLPPFRST